MEPLQVGQLVVGFVAGLLAGGVNVVVGAGTLLSFPLLVLTGQAPLVATIANTIGIVPGSAAGVAVYRRELRALRGVVKLLLPASVLGAVAGAMILLSFPAQVFTAVVPWLIALGTVLVLVGPKLKEHVGRKNAADTSHGKPFGSKALLAIGVAGTFLLGMYGGYFSAAQGILLIALLGVVSRLELQELNAIKNLTVFAVNVIAAVVFLVVSPELIDWLLVAAIAAGAVCGGMIGGRFARRLSAPVLRGFVVVVGIVAVVVMVGGNLA